MYGSDYAWILQGGPSDIWWENVTECPQYHLSAAVEGLLLVSSHNSIVGVLPSYSGLVSRWHSFRVEQMDFMLYIEYYSQGNRLSN